MTKLLHFLGKTVKQSSSRKRKLGVMDNVWVRVALHQITKTSTKTKLNGNSLHLTIVLITNYGNILDIDGKIYSI